MTTNINLDNYDYSISGSSIQEGINGGNSEVDHLQITKVFNRMWTDPIAHLKGLRNPYYLHVREPPRQYIPLSPVAHNTSDAFARRYAPQDWRAIKVQARERKRKERKQEEEYREFKSFLKVKGQELVLTPGQKVPRWARNPDNSPMKKEERNISEVNAPRDDGNQGKGNAGIDLINPENITQSSYQGQEEEISKERAIQVAATSPGIEEGLDVKEEARQHITTPRFGTSESLAISEDSDDDDDSDDDHIYSYEGPPNPKSQNSSEGDNTEGDTGSLFDRDEPLNHFEIHHSDAGSPTSSVTDLSTSSHNSNIHSHQNNTTNQHTNSATPSPSDTNSAVKMTVDELEEQLRREDFALRCLKDTLYQALAANEVEAKGVDYLIHREYQTDLAYAQLKKGFPKKSLPDPMPNETCAWVLHPIASARRIQDELSFIAMMSDIPIVIVTTPEGVEHTLEERPQFLRNDFDYYCLDRDDEQDWMQKELEEFRDIHETFEAYDARMCCDEFWDDCRRQDMAREIVAWEAQANEDSEAIISDGEDSDNEED